LTTSTNVLNDLVIDDLVPDFKGFILLVFFTSKKDIVHAEPPTVKFGDVVPGETELGAC